MKAVFKKIKSIVLVPVTDSKVTVFNSAIEKNMYQQQHPDASITNLLGFEPMYMLVDTDGAGFNLTQSSVTYNEALTLINMYY